MVSTSPWDTGPMTRDRRHSGACAHSAGPSACARVRSAPVALGSGRSRCVAGAPRRATALGGA
eukprot:10932452-Alexandrium_andersonii.AAC.1